MLAFHNIDEVCDEVAFAASIIIVSFSSTVLFSKLLSVMSYIFLWLLPLAFSSKGQLCRFPCWGCKSPWNQWR